MQAPFGQGVPGPFAQFRIGGALAVPVVARHFAAGGLTPQMVADFAGASGREGYAKPLPVLGPELVVNGRFDDASGWGGGGGGGMPTISGGVADYGPHTSGASFLTRTGETLTAGYSMISFDADEAGELYIDPGTGTYDIVHSVVAGRNEVPAFTGSGNLALRSNVAGAYAGTIDNISVREITGYRAVSTKFTDLLTHSRSGNATMVDSDGKLKWAPHNLLTWSEDFTNAAWVKVSGSSVDGSRVVERSGGGISGLDQSVAAPAGTYTATVVLEAGEREYGGLRIAANTYGNRYSAIISLTDGSVVSTRETSSPMGHSHSVNDLGDGRYELSLTIYHAGGNLSSCVIMNDDATVTWDVTGIPAYAGDGVSGIHATKPHVYRSDLGGMVDNPDTGDSYVPTTSAARFLPRRNHHVWDGSAWVNKGVRHEDQARTNLFPSSEDLSTTAWAKVSATVAEQAEEDGRVWRLTCSADGHASINEPTAKAAAALDYTLSFKARKSVGDYVVITLQGAGSSNRIGVCFNIETGAVALSPLAAGGFSLIGLDIEEADGEYFYIRVSATSDADTSITPYIGVSLLPKQNVDQVVSGSSPASCDLKHLQFEQAATPSSYIPTNDATAIRPADVLTPPAANLPFHPDGFWIRVSGLVTYADTDATTGTTGAPGEVQLVRWLLDGTNFITTGIDTGTTKTGQMDFFQREGASGLDTSEGSGGDYAPGVNVPFSIASRHGPTYINGAVDGVALTANNTPTALPNLSATDMQLGYDFMGIISSFAMGAGDPGDVGIAEASA